MKSLAKFFRNILLTTLFIPVFCFSQKPVLGIKLGVSLSNTAISSTETSSRTGILGGVYLDIHHGKKLIVRPGIEIVSKGAVLEENGYPDHYSLRFTYLDFPINFLYRTNFIKGHLLAGGGPSVGVPIKDIYNSHELKTEFGVNGLIGYEIPIGASLMLNYNYGLSNASKNNDSGEKISNRYFGITLGYSF